MIIIYGLGNNDKKYLDTKHNIGRRVVELLADKQGLTFSTHKGYYYTKSIDSKFSLLYMYSAGYMNESGRPLIELCRYNSIDWSDPTTHLLIIQDDSDQLEGRVKLSPQGGSAGHRGIDSIYREILGSHIAPEKVWRLKLGIRPQGNTQKSETFVLSRLSQQDTKTITAVTDSLIQSFALLHHNDWGKAQTLLNSITIA